MLEEMEEEEDELEVVGGVVELMGGVVEWLEVALWLLVLQAMMTAKMRAMMTASLDLLLSLLLTPGQLHLSLEPGKGYYFQHNFVDGENTAITWYEFWEDKFSSSSGAANRN